MSANEGKLFNNLLKNDPISWVSKFYVTFH